MNFQVIYIYIIFFSKQHPKVGLPGCIIYSNPILMFSLLKVKNPSRNLEQLSHDINKLPSPFLPASLLFAVNKDLARATGKVGPESLLKNASTKSAPSGGGGSHSLLFPVDEEVD